jgi:hypothetical protein
MNTIPEEGSVCIPNISTRERRKRLRFGGIMFGIGVVLLSSLVGWGTNRWWRVAVFPLFWGAGSGFFQWRDKT